MYLNRLWILISLGKHRTLKALIVCEVYRKLRHYPRDLVELSRVSIDKKLDFNCGYLNHSIDWIPLLFFRQIVAVYEFTLHFCGLN